MRRAPALLVAGLVLAGGERAAGAAGLPGPDTTNPYLGQAAAIDEGRQLYGRRCFVCHLDRGGRGPDLAASAAKLSDQRFFSAVMNGRTGTQMPAFKGLIGPDEVWKIHAFLKARPPGSGLDFLPGQRR